MWTLVAVLAFGYQEPAEPPRPVPGEERRRLERERALREESRPPAPLAPLPPIPFPPPGGRSAQGSRTGEPPPSPHAVENPDLVRSWLRENDPETSRRLEELGAGDRGNALYLRLLTDAEMRMRQFSDMKARDPKEFERMLDIRRLEAESAQLAERARGASVEEREGVARLLSATLGKLFDLREDSRRRDVEELKKRVEALEKELQTRKGNKERIVEQRKREMLGERGEFDW